MRTVPILLRFRRSRSRRLCGLFVCEVRVMIKLIASDLDGTLLKEGTMDINPEIYEIIRKLKAKGMIFISLPEMEGSFPIRVRSLRKWQSRRMC